MEFGFLELESVSARKQQERVCFVYLYSPVSHIVQNPKLHENRDIVESLKVKQDLLMQGCSQIFIPSVNSVRETSGGIICKSLISCHVRVLICGGGRLKYKRNEEGIQ